MSNNPPSTAASLSLQQNQGLPANQSSTSPSLRRHHDIEHLEAGARSCGLGCCCRRYAQRPQGRSGEDYLMMTLVLQESRELPMTNKRLMVLLMLELGYRYSAIAEVMQISVRTVEYHVEKLAELFEVKRSKNMLVKTFREAARRRFTSFTKNKSQQCGVGATNPEENLNEP